MLQLQTQAASHSLTTAACRSAHDKTSPRRTGLRRYVAFLTIILSYLLFRFLAVWEAVQFIAPAPTQPTAELSFQQQACWQTQVEVTAGAAPCHDDGVDPPEGNAKVWHFERASGPALRQSEIAASRTQTHTLAHNISLPRTHVTLCVAPDRCTFLPMSVALDCLFS